MNRPTPNAVPVVSFGLPVRNGAPTIAQAIESVLAQTFDDWELVISDNLSTDGTSEICACVRRARRAHSACPVGSRPVDYTRTSVRPSVSRAEPTSGGRETTTGWSRSTPSVPSPRLRVAGIGSLHDRSAVLPRRRPLPVNDPFPVLGGVDSMDPGARVRALLRLFQNGGHLGIDPVYSLVRRDVAAQTGLQAPSATATSCTPARWRSSGRSSTCRRSWHIADCSRTRLGISRHLFQRELSISVSRERRRA